MLTKFGKLLSPKTMPYLSASYSQTGVGEGIKCTMKVKDYTGTLRAVTPFTYDDDYVYSNGPLSNTSSGVKFGSGNSEESEDSYTLDNVISSGLSVASDPSNNSVRYAYDAENNIIEEYVLYTITNTSSENITIAEIGIFEETLIGSDVGETATSGRSSFLIDRAVLDTPLVLAPNDSAVVRYAFSLPGSEI